MTKPVAKKLSDYRPPTFSVGHLNLEFHLDPDKTKVISRFSVERLDSTATSLVLDGEDLELQSVAINGKDTQNFTKTENALHLVIENDKADIEIVSFCAPNKNTSLEGLYYANGAFCTQCEAEGFRKITYFLDRPDVLTRYQVKLIADKQRYPFLLSNGNCIGSGDYDESRHWIEWQDPHKKPSYLFAVVAGDFDKLTDEFITRSGNNVALELFVEKGQAAKGQHALDSLKKAMKWDEDVFGLEYDLDIYMIVAVDFFNMGAMENKGLNVFNSKFVLANAETATDQDFFNIESIIAHEYFHNWTGNRVTCRDWFQLSLKEGLTVFRDQKFSEDMGSALATRIDQVKRIKEHQFAEDASPMSHPIRPQSVIEMNNFYTVTVYDKGAEVIRMMHTVLGHQGFVQGMNLYFERHDGQAVTCDDFVNAMQDANDVDLGLFKRWYQQSGTPVIKASENFDAESGQYHIALEQQHFATADQKQKETLHIPIAYELIDKSTEQVVASDVLNLKSTTATISLSGQLDKPVPVLLTGFSAPVKLDFRATDEDLVYTALHSGNELARWDATQQLYSRLIWDGYDKGEMTVDANALISEFSRPLFEAKYDDLTLLAEMLTLPSIENLMGQREQLDIGKLLLARKSLLAAFSQNVAEQCLKFLSSLQHKAYHYNAEDVARRTLAAKCLFHVTLSGLDTKMAEQQFHQADNMTDTLAALRALQLADIAQFDNAMCEFEKNWRSEVQVLDKWMSLHASTERHDILARLDLLSGHQSFDIANPNRVRALVGTFAFYNTDGFHKEDGSGYRYVADYLIKLNEVNPQVAARVVTPLLSWQKFDAHRQDLMKTQLMRIADVPSISRDLYEKVSKSLGY
ncbi:MAG: aminopeptidase N [Aestuariibacter sp.]